MNNIDKLLDCAWSKLVKLRAKNICEVEGCDRTDVSAHHFHGRRKLSVRWDLDNGFCLCYSHHVDSEVFSAHKTLDAFRDWAILKRGVKWFEDLLLKANSFVKLTKFDKKELLNKLTNLAH